MQGIGKLDLEGKNKITGSRNGDKNKTNGLSLDCLKWRKTSSWKQGQVIMQTQEQSRWIVGRIIKLQIEGN